MKRASIVIALVALATFSTIAQQTSPRELYERARLMEQGNRTKEAIALYSQVVSQAKDDRALAGEAELRKAFLLERQGRPEAKQAFADVIRKYSDQPQLVAQARARTDAGLRVGRQNDLTPRRIARDDTF